MTSARSKNGPAGGPQARGGKVDPRLRVPSWRSAFVRALFAAAVFALVMIVLMKAAPGGVAVTTVLLLGIYTPFGYYFDSFLYRRRMAKLGQPVATPAKRDVPRPTLRKRKR